MTKYVLEGFDYCVTLPMESLDKSFEIQSWCESKFGLAEDGGWALGYGGNPNLQTWYFREGKNAMLFKLKWS